MPLLWLDLEQISFSRRVEETYLAIYVCGILIVGLGFKRGQSVLSHSPGKAFAVHLLATNDVYIEFADPLIEQSAVSFVPRFDDATWSEETLRRFDAIVVAVDQPGYDDELLDRVQRSGTAVEWFSRH